MGAVVVVTGAESGIGEQTVRKFLKNSCQVIGLDITKKVNSNHEDPEYQFIEIDLTKLEDMRETMKSIYQKRGRIDILVNCAGVTSLKKVNEIQSEDWDKMMNINLKSVFFCCQAVLEYMKAHRSGKIINVSSNAGKSGGKAVGVHYSVSKAGVICLTQSLALDAALFNINVNCVAPGPTKTAMTENWDDSVNLKLKEKIPMGRFADPEEIAEAILFLASEKAVYITGETMNVNGGLLMD